MSFQKYYYSYQVKSSKKNSILQKFFSGIGVLLITLIVSGSFAANIPLPFASPLPIAEKQTAQDVKNKYEVFGFAPHWTINKLDNIDFSVLTTLAYFGMEIHPDGSFAHDAGHEVFYSDRATELFNKAHKNGTRVVLTITQMDNGSIEQIMDDKDAQEKIISQTVETVVDRGIDGVNIDFEYMGDPGQEYRDKFSTFVANLTDRMHNALPNSHVTVSVYASAIKDPKIYDIGFLADKTDGIFMMAYDFATAGSDNVIPTAPLHGHKEGKYWYDVSTAVDDFLTVMPPEKLILGLPWYGYNYPVTTPEVKAPKDTGYYTYYYWRGRRYSRFVPRERASAQTYTLAKNNDSEMQGWDEYGKVSWHAYKDASGQWRMIFLDDEKSLSLKYDFAKEKNLGGVGMWALGFDAGKKELWSLLSEKFGAKLVDARTQKRQI